MLSRSRLCSMWPPAVWVAVLLFPAALTAAEPNAPARGKAKPPAEAVEIFAAMECGQIEVEVIPKDSTQARLLITNKTAKPLRVQLPPALAVVPVLAQFPPAFQQNNAPQQIGGGPNQNPFGQGMMNIGGPGGGNQQNFLPGFQFSVPPEKLGKLKLTTVCLEHGRPNPSPRVEYELKPIASVTDKPGVAEVCAMLAKGELPQRVAQLAAWHLNNDMSWEQLGGIQKKAAFGKRPRYTAKEIAVAKEAARQATKLAKKPAAKTSGSSR